jgi:hypothetical protein
MYILNRALTLTTTGIMTKETCGEEERGNFSMMRHVEVNVQLHIMFKLCTI